MEEKIDAREMMGVGGIERGSSGMKVASLFAGAGGLDLGFQKVGFDVV